MLKKIIIFGLIFWNVLIATLSLLNTDDLPSISVNHIDKFYHLFFYTVLAIFWNLFYFSLSKINIIKQYSLSFVFSFTLGLLLEYMQKLSGFRTFDWFDVLFNTLGIIFGTIIVILSKDFLIKKIFLN